MFKFKIVKFAALCYGAYKLLSNALIRKLLFVFLKHEGRKLLTK